MTPALLRTALLAALLAAPAAAFAQMAQPAAPMTPVPMTPALTAPAAAATDPAAPAKPRPVARRPAGPRPAAAITVTNARDVVASQISVIAGDKTVRTSKALGPNAKAVLKLPKMKGCMVTVAAMFDGDDQATEVGEVDVCREKSIRLTDG